MTLVTFLKILGPLMKSSLEYNAGKFGIVLDQKNIEFFVQDLSWSLACPTGPRLTTHATGGARGALRLIGPIQLRTPKATIASSLNCPAALKS